MASAGDIITFLGIAVKAVQYLQDVRHGSKERDALSDHITSLRAIFAGRESVNPLVATDLSKEEQENAWNLINQLNPRLHDLQQDLDQKPKPFNELWARVRWPSRKTEVRQNLTDLENAINNIKSFQDLATLKRSEWNRVRKWIRPEIADQVSRPYFESVTPDTGKGLLSSDEFEDWERSSNGILWCNGPQGSGKTGQIKVVQEHFANSNEDSKHSVAVVYCTEQELKSLRDPMDIVMSLWAQLDNVRGQQELHIPREILEELIETHKIDGLSTLSTERAVKLKMDIICHHIATSPPTVLILDGLDEVPIHSLYSLQRDIVEKLKEIQKRTNNCRILIASRPYSSIRRIFYSTRSSEEHAVFNYRVEVAELDLERYIKEQIKKQDWDLQDWGGGDSIEQRVIDVLVPKCRGEESFLLARLYMHEVLKAGSSWELDSIMTSLPKNVNDAYDKGLRRLSQECAESSNGLPCKAIQAIYWVICAKRPLKIEELEQILAIDEDESGTDHDCRGSISLGSGIESFCGQLVVVDSLSAQVYVEHKTFIEYLTLPETQRTWWQDRSLSQYMASILMTYLSRKSMRESSTADWDHSATKCPLLDFALRYWGDYLIDVNEDSPIWERVFLFLTGPAKEWNEYVNTKARSVVVDKHPETVYGGNDALATGHLGLLHWAVHFDLVALIRRLFNYESSFPTQTPVPISPLGLAVSHKDEITRQLLDCGANVNDYGSLNRPRRPPLYDAVGHGESGPVRALLQAGAQWTLKRADNDNSTLHLLYYHLGRDHLALLAATTMSNEELTTPEGLQLLIKGKFRDQLRIALASGLDINIPCDNGKRALDYAYELGDTELIELLTNHGATARLTWPAFTPESSVMPQNFPDVQPTGAFIIKEADQFPRAIPGQPDAPWKSSREQMLLEVQIHAKFELPVQCLVFETLSCDQGWSSHDGKGTYLGSGDGCSLFVRVQNAKSRYVFDLQVNVQADDTPRLHTNVWNLSDLDKSFPVRAQCMKEMQSGTSLQVVARDRKKGWRNDVRFVRVRVYGEEMNL